MFCLVLRASWASAVTEAGLSSGARKYPDGPSPWKNVYWVDAMSQEYVEANDWIVDNYKGIPVINESCSRKVCLVGSQFGFILL